MPVRLFKVDSWTNGPSQSHDKGQRNKMGSVIKVASRIKIMKRYEHF